MRVMFIGAHPDDIELGAGGSLVKHVKRGDEILYVVLSRGERGGDPEERMKEVMHVIGSLHIRNYRLLSYPDARLNEVFNEIKDLLEGLVNEFKPDRIYTHSLRDYHQDHRAVAEASRIAGRYVSQILSYWSPSMYNDFAPSYFIDISEYMDEKFRILESFRSQGRKDFMKRETMVSINRYFGFIVNTMYAEGFEVIRFKEL